MKSDEAQILWINAEFSDRINSMTGSADLYDDTDHLVTINQRVKNVETQRVIQW